MSKRRPAVVAAVGTEWRQWVWGIMSQEKPLRRSDSCGVPPRKDSDLHKRWVSAKFRPSGWVVN